MAIGQVATVEKKRVVPSAERRDELIHDPTGHADKLVFGAPRELDHVNGVEPQAQRLVPKRRGAHLYRRPPAPTIPKLPPAKSKSPPPPSKSSTWPKSSPFRGRPGNRPHRQRGTPPPISLPGFAPPRNVPQHPPARQSRLRHTPVSSTGRAGLCRSRDAHSFQVHPERRSRIPRPLARQSGEILRAAPVSSAVQADAHGRRHRTVFPDRKMFSR